MTDHVYYKYSEYLIKKYGKKTYKLPVNIPATCPNRDGNISTGGCSYCGEEGAGFETFANQVSVKDQLYINREHIKKRYNAEKFIAYFQNYSNTYIGFDDFQKYMLEAAECDIVEIAVATRPDVLLDKHILFLEDLRRKTGIEITIEMGLQTANYHILKQTNRGHTLAEFIDACLRIQKLSDIETCAHVILNLPNSDMVDTIETAKILSALKIDSVKLHSLFIMENAAIADDYLKGKFEIISKDEYVERVIVFLEYLNPLIPLQRLIGRAPKEGSLFVNWGMSWRKIQNEIEEKMEKESRKQGQLFNYLGGIEKII